MSGMSTVFMGYNQFVASKKPLVYHIKLDEAILKRLDDFRFTRRFESRSDALRWLLNWALDQKPAPPERR